MVTGWYQDTDGNLYYLNPVSDGTLGGMVTGWRWIDGKCYYFQKNSDGTKGALIKNTVTPDGYQVNESGEWIVDGVVQKKE
jgi:glucan-binding YG repeat protein